eukprot:4971539-Heterocapsa_arctica.AAC.1
MAPRARHRAGRTAAGGPRVSRRGSLHRAGSQPRTMGTANIGPMPGLRTVHTTRMASCSKLGRVVGEY